ncbi:MAG: Fic family protein [Gammaproteobacteria bacterium]
MDSLTPDYLDALSFGAEQLATLRSVGEYRGKQTLYFHQAPETLKALREVAVIESSESSNRLEGVTVSPGRLAPLVLRRTDPKNRSEQELAGYRDALALVHESAREMQFTGNVMLQLHGLLCRYLPDKGGRWKSTNNDIIEKNPDGSMHIRFTPTPAHLVPTQIHELENNYRAAADSGRHEPLVLVPLAILGFLCIHPFRDGNGRIARLLSLMMLYRFNYEVGRYISLERIIEESKETYYETLEASSQGWHEGRHDVMPWLNYFWGVLLRAYREFEERVGAVHRGRGAKTEQVRLAVLARQQPFAISDIEAECAGVSRDMVRHVLRRMKQEQLIELRGKGRGAKWIVVKTTGEEK